MGGVWGVGMVRTVGERRLLGGWHRLPFSVQRKHPYWIDEDLILQGENKP